jgi:hypothetical protein
MLSSALWLLPLLHASLRLQRSPVIYKAVYLLHVSPFDLATPHRVSRSPADSS